MKKHLLSGIIVCILGFGTGGAEAQYYHHSPAEAGPYFRVDIGPSVFEDGRLTGFGGPVSAPVNYDVGMAANLAVGWNFNRYIGTDFELGYVGAQLNDVPGFFWNDARISNMPFLANVTLSLPLPNTRLVPYIGAGAGGSDVAFDTDGFSDGGTIVFGRADDVVFAWQAFAGLRFKVNKCFSLGLGYKYFATGNSSFDYSPGFHVNFNGARTHSVLLTAQFRF